MLNIVKRFLEEHGVPKIFPAAPKSPPQKPKYYQTVCLDCERGFDLRLEICPYCGGRFSSPILSLKRHIIKGAN